MSRGSHVILHSLLRVECHRTCLAWNGREPMILRVHMVDDSVFTREGASACQEFRTHAVYLGSTDLIYVTQGLLLGSYIYHPIS